MYTRVNYCLFFVVHTFPNIWGFLYAAFSLLQKRIFAWKNSICSSYKR